MGFLCGRAYHGKWSKKAEKYRTDVEKIDKTKETKGDAPYLPFKDHIWNSKLVETHEERNEGIAKGLGQCAQTGLKTGGAGLLFVVAALFYVSAMCTWMVDGTFCIIQLDSGYW